MVDRHYSLNLKPWSARTLYADLAQKYSRFCLQVVLPGRKLFFLPWIIIFQTMVTTQPGFFSGFSLGSVFAEKIEFSWAAGGLGQLQEADTSFSYPEPFLRAVNGRRRGALAKSISNWHLISKKEGYCSNNVYIFYHVFMVSGFGFGQSPSSHRA
jgi:hypothetical protein